MEFSNKLKDIFSIFNLTGFFSRLCACKP